MGEELRILILEDVPADAELIEHELRKTGLVFTSKLADTREAFLKKLDDFKPNLILSDYKLPSFNGLEALKIVQERYPDMPFILVTGELGEEFAIETLKKGARDYVIKDNLKRLGPSVQRALQEAEEITERKRLQRVLQESEKAYRFLAENTNDMITRHLPDGMYLYVSPACRTLLGYEPGDLIGTNAFEQMHPEDVKRIIAITQDAVRTGGFGMAQYRHLKKDGRYIWVETTGKVVKNEITGDIEDIICVVRDITERKRAEEKIRESESRFRSLVENNPMGIWQDDVDQRTVYANKTILDMLEIENLDEITGKNWQSFFTQESLEIIEREHKRRVEGIISSYEIEIIGKRGSKRTVVVFGTPLFLPDGQFHGTIATFFDITERKKMEKEINKRVKDLEEFYRMAVGRELRMIELKEEIDRLKRELENYKKQ